MRLVDRSSRKILTFGLQIQRAEGLLVLRDVLPQHIPQRLCLLGAEKNRLVVANRNLVGAFTGSESKDQLKVPNADAHLHAVGVAFAVIGCLGKIQLRLL